MENEIKTRLKGINNLLAGQGFTAVYQGIFKNNRNRDGVVLKGEGCNCSPVIYFDDRVWQGTDQEIADYMKIFFFKYGGDRDVEELQTKEYILGHVLPRVVSQDGIPELEQGGVAYVPLMDMAVYFYVPLKEALQDDDMLSSFCVLDCMLQLAGIGLDELCRAAKDNMAGECVVDSLPAVLGKLIGQECGEDAGSPVMLLVSNRWNIHGAGAIYSEKMLEKIAGMLGSRYFILPSSIHELICVPASGLDLEECTDMVAGINALHVRPDERLTDSVYIWDNGDLECHPHKER